MGNTTKKIADRLLDAAEAEYRCAFACSRSESMALARRHRLGTVVEFEKGYFLRTEVYEALSVRARVMYLIRAMSRRHPDWVFASFSAALVYGLQVSRELMGAIHLAVDPRASRRRRGHAVVCHAVEDDAASVVEGIRVTSLERTLLDCLCQTDFQNGLAVADSALHWKLIARSSLQDCVDKRGAGRRGVRTAREVLRWVDGRSENGGESVARAVMIELGFAVPELQVEVADPLVEGATRRVDYFWELPDGRTVIGELDGRGKYKIDGGRAGDIDAAVKKMAEERLRETHLNLTDATVIRFSYRRAIDRDYMRRLLTRAGVPRRER